MATNRFGYSDDFVLNNGKVGINSATPQEKLDVVGVVKGDTLKVTGVSSFTTYEGFLNSNQNITESISLEAGQGITGSLSGEIIVGTGITVTGIGSATSGQGYIESLKVYNTFTVPVGGTTDRPSKAKPGQLFFNRDFATMEFWDGDRWRQVDNTTRSGKMLFSPGFTTGGTSTAIDTINAHSLGNATDFGILSSSRSVYGGGGGNSTRGLFGGGYNYSNVIDYVTIQSAGNAIDFGDLTKPNYGTSNSSSSTRSVFYKGYTNTPAVAADTGIDYVEISTTGNALDFGTNDHTVWSGTGFASPTRGIHAATYGNFSLIKFITIASKGNAIYFGDAGIAQVQSAGCSNSVRGIYSGGYVTERQIMNIIISSTGTGVKFGDLSVGRQGFGSASTQTRGIFAGGNNPTVLNTIDYINLTTGGNAQDFGDLTITKRNTAGISDSHGGLGGF
jgi:hypothetical protein